MQKQLAEELHRKANVPLHRCGIEEVKQFQATLLEYQIHILSKDHFNATVYSGPGGGIPIYLYSHDNHYDVITTMTRSARKDTNTKNVMSAMIFVISAGSCTPTKMRTRNIVLHATVTS